MARSTAIGRLLAALVLGATPLATAQQTPPGAVAVDLADTLPVDPQVTVGILDNGLRYYVRANQRPEQRAELRLVVNAGSVLEDEDQRGLAHFLEHMAFNGTRNFPKQDLVDYLEGIGMRFGPDINAYTSFDETVYMLTVPTDSAGLLATAFQILEDWARYQVFDPEEIEKERGVVLEEWRLGRGADARMQAKQFPILFQGSRYAERLPIGEREIIETFEHEILKRYYADWYRPDLMAVIAVGDFDPRAVEELMRKHFAGLPAPTSLRQRLMFDVPDHDETLFAVATDKEATYSQVSIYFKQPLRPMETVAAYRQMLVERLYNRILNSRLFELTQTPDAPFIGAYSGQGRFVRSKEVYVLGALVPDGGINTGLEAVMTEAERVARHGFAASELDRNKRELLRDMEQAYAEREKTESAAYASEYTRHFLVGEPIPGIALEYEMAQRFVPLITLDEVNQLARTWISDRNRVVLANAPEKEGVEVPREEELGAVFGTVLAKEIAPYEDAVPDAPLVAEIPESVPVVSEETIEEVGVTVWVLANGVRVILKPTDFKDDEVLVSGWSAGGTSLVPDEDYVPAMTAARAVSVGGVGQFSLIELDKALAGKAVRVSPFVSSLYEGVSGSGSPQDLETLFQLVYLYFTAPRRDSTAFLAYQARMKANLENISASPEAEFWDTVQVTMTQHHPRARPITSELYDQMDLTKSFALYQDRFADAGDFSFVFVGSFDLDSLRPLAQTYLGALPSTGREETWRDVGIDPPVGVIHKTVRRGVEPKSTTVIAFTGEFEDSRRHRHALRSLGDVMQIRLRERLREDLGGTYGASVSAGSSLYPDAEYSIRITFGSAPERVDELVGVVFQQIDSLKTVGPTDVEIGKVQEMQRRGRETNLKQNGYWRGQLVGYDRQGLDFRDILTYENLIDALEVSTVRDAARRWLRTDNYVQVTLYPENMN